MTVDPRVSERIEAKLDDDDEQVHEFFYGFASPVHPLVVAAVMVMILVGAVAVGGNPVGAILTLAAGVALVWWWTSTYRIVAETDGDLVVLKSNRWRIGHPDRPLGRYPASALDGWVPRALAVAKTEDLGERIWLLGLTRRRSAD